MNSPYIRTPEVNPYERVSEFQLFELVWRWSLYGGLALLPFMMWRFHPDIQLTFSDGFFVIALAFALFTGRLNVNFFGGVTPLWILAILLMLAGLGASSFVNGDPIRFGIVSSQYLFAYLILPLVILLPRPQEQLPLIAIYVATVVAIEAFSIAMFYLNSGNPSGTDWINHNFVTGAERLGSFFGSANRNAAFVSLTVPFVLYLARAGIWPLWATIPSMLVLGLAILLTASVTGLTSSLLAIALFVFAAYGKHAWKVVVVCVGVVSLLWASGFTLPETFQERVLGAAESGDISEAGTYTGRMALVEEAIKLSDEVGFLGLGADQFRAVSDEEAPVHNVYLLIWTEGGPFSLLGWLLAMGIFAWIGLRSFATDRAAGALVLAVGVAFLIISNASTHIYARMWVIPVLFAMQAGVLCLQREKRQYPQSPAAEVHAIA
ncbi:O-antigen ligase family protein [Aurantiacibacter poecillastricola]|uniref:O-antigen ligase family protein n=1 Tax=Aurantiacibacter poecillastricola TaxID=3064385 RepID=UPI00273DAF4E|nr:O-antigen ligase family protein [Aurantiacibacter sp. 219JJ12-13]MDP5259994.1 hypothetical protein [Aurantiacibacter sp. 219JJ12-13]